MDEETLRSRLVDTARGHLGQGEQGGDNRGEFIRRINGGDKSAQAPRHSTKDPAWCALFASYVTDGVAPGLVSRTGRSSDLRDQAEKAGALRPVRPEHLRPGNLIFMPRGDGAGLHVGMIGAVDHGKGTVSVIDGNRFGSSGHHIGERTPRPEARGAGFEAKVAENTYDIEYLSRQAGGVADLGTMARAKGMLTPSPDVAAAPAGKDFSKLRLDGIDLSKLHPESRHVPTGEEVRPAGARAEASQGTRGR